LSQEESKFNLGGLERKEGKKRGSGYKDTVFKCRWGGEGWKSMKKSGKKTKDTLWYAGLAWKIFCGGATGFLHGDNRVGKVHCYNQERKNELSQCSWGLKE